ncbi:MAG: FAD-binding oxidoreductase, partial [Bacteroidia bacterium]|nr:FAD-binding oxidoreductase [Bacteroidia bacterium]
DFLIVGGGLAGHILQIQLQEKGCSSIVIDYSKSNASSVVAAGLVNPVAGKFFTLTWRAEEIFESLATFYSDVENRLNSSFFTPKTLTRIFATPGEQNIWLSKAHQDKYKSYCSFKNIEIKGLKSNYGVLEIAKGGELDVSLFLGSCKASYSNRNEKFDFEKLNVKSKSYDDIKYKNIVFCEGYEVLYNPYFNHLPFVPTKGELLEIETSLPQSNTVYLGPVFMQPRGGKLWKVGATYAPNIVDKLPTKEKKDDLIKRLNKIIDVPYNIVNQTAGIRPATEDRRPLIGRHSSNENMYVFNGFGSKGVSLIPLLAKEFIDFVLNNAPLHPEVNINRF